MKKHLQNLFIAFFLFLVIPATSQDIELNWSKEYQTKEFAKNYPSLIAKDNNYFYGAFYKKNELTILKFDRETLTKTEVYSILLKSKNVKYRTFEFIKFVKGKFYIFTSEYSKSKDKFYLFCTKLSSDGEIELEDEIIESYEAKKSKYVGNYRNELSSDSSSLILFHNFYLKSKKDKESFAFKIFNLETLELISDVDATLPYKDNDFSLEDILMDSKNKVWIKCSLYDKETKQDYSKLLFFNTGVSNDLEEIDFETKSKSKKQTYYGSWAFSFDETDNLLCFGNYGEKVGRKYSGYKGVFTLKLDANTRDVINEDYKKFEIKQIEEAGGKKAVKKDKGVTNIKMKDVFKIGNSTFIISEISYSYESCQTTTTNGVTTTKCVYHFVNNNIFVTKMNESGTIEWIKTINKYQNVTGTNAYNSFCNSKSLPIKFVYLDAAKKFKKNPNADDYNNLDKRYTMVNPLKSTATYAEIDDNGVVSITPLFNTKDADKYILKPQSSLQLNDNEIILYAVKGKKIKFLKAKF